MKRARIAVLFFGGVVAASCSGSPPAVVPNPAECAPVVERARQNPGDTAIKHASPMELFLPALPAPPQLVGRTAIIHLRVTEQGLVVAPSVDVGRQIPEGPSIAILTPDLAPGRDDWTRATV